MELTISFVLTLYTRLWCYDAGLDQGQQDADVELLLNALQDAYNAGKDNHIAIVHDAFKSVNNCIAQELEKLGIDIK